MAPGSMTRYLTFAVVDVLISGLFVTYRAQRHESVVPHGLAEVLLDAHRQRPGRACPRFHRLRSS